MCLWLHWACVVREGCCIHLQGGDDRVTSNIWFRNALNFEKSSTLVIEHCLYDSSLALWHTAVPCADESGRNLVPWGKRLDSLSVARKKKVSAVGYFSVKDSIIENLTPLKLQNFICKLRLSTKLIQSWCHLKNECFWLICLREIFLGSLFIALHWLSAWLRRWEHKCLEAHSLC